MLCIHKLLLSLLFVILCMQLECALSSEMKVNRVKRDEAADDTDAPPPPNSDNAEPPNAETEPVVPVPDNSGSNPTSGGEESVTDPDDTSGNVDTGGGLDTQDSPTLPPVDGDNSNGSAEDSPTDTNNGSPGEAVPTPNQAIDANETVAWSNLRAKTIRVATIHYPPWTIRKESDVNDQNPTGYIPDLMNLLKSRLGFAGIEWVYKKKFGYIENNEWNGALGAVINEDADLAASPMTITAARKKAVKFLVPFKSTGLQVLMRKAYWQPTNRDHEVLKSFNILTALSSTVWALTILAMFLVSILLYVNNRINPYEWKRRNELGRASTSEGESFNFVGSMWFAFTTLTWQGYERAPHSIAAKVLSSFWVGYCTIFILTFIGSLVTMLFWNSTIHGKDLSTPPARDLAHILQDDTVIVGCTEHSSTYAYLVQAKQQIYKDVYAHFQDTDYNGTVPSTTVGVNRARAEKYAFITESLTAKYYSNLKPCDLTTVGPVFAKRSYGMPIKNDTSDEELRLWNMAILQIAESGDADALEHKWWNLYGDCWNAKKMEDSTAHTQQILMSTTPQRVDLGMFYAPVIILLVGVILCLLTAAGEVLYYKYKGRYNTSGNNYQRNNLPGGGELRLDHDEMN